MKIGSWQLWACVLACLIVCRARPLAWADPTPPQDGSSGSTTGSPTGEKVRTGAGETSLTDGLLPEGTKPVDVVGGPLVPVGPSIVCKALDWLGSKRAKLVRWGVKVTVCGAERTQSLSSEEHEEREITRFYEVYTNWVYRCRKETIENQVCKQPRGHYGAHTYTAVGTETRHTALEGKRECCRWVGLGGEILQESSVKGRFDPAHADHQP